MAAFLDPVPAYGSSIGGMSTVTVYQFEIYDQSAGMWKRSGQYATLEHIAGIQGAVPLMGLRWVVDAHRVDASGLLWPPELSARL